MAYIGKSPTGTGVRQRYYFTATGGETSLSGSDDNGLTLTFSDGKYVDVMLNGVTLVAGTDYNTSTATNTISNLAALSASDIVEIVVYDIFTVADTVSAKNGGTFSGNVAMNGTLSVTGASTLTGDLTVDTNTLYVDSTNNRVGIGTSSPSRKISLDGGAGTQTWTGYQQAGTEKFVVGLDASGNPSLYGTQSAPMIFYTNNTEKMRLDSSGNVGIGLSSNISSKLHVNTEMSIGADGDNRAIIGYTPSRFYIGTRQSGTNYFDTFNVSGGKVGIGTTPSAHVFEVSGTSTIAKFNATALTDRVITTNQNTAGDIIVFDVSNTAKGSISTNGSSVSYNTSSDYRLKTAVTYDWDATTRLKQLRPARFEWIADGNDAVPVDGFLAHEVQDIVPEAISGTKDGMRDEEYQVSAATGDIYTPAIEAVLDEDGNEVTPAVAEVIHSTDVERPEALTEGQQWRETTPAVMGTRSVPDYQGIDQSKLTPLLTKALIEAVEKIEQLETRIAALENV